MKTKCFCVECERHPLYARRNEFKEYWTGFSPDDARISLMDKYADQGADVDCLIPGSGASDFVDLEDFEYPVTAYGDGDVVTGVDESDLVIFATCTNCTDNGRAQ